VTVFRTTRRQSGHCTPLSSITCGSGTRTAVTVGSCAALAIPFPRQRSQNFQSQYNTTQSTTQTSAAQSSATITAMANAATEVTPSRNTYHSAARQYRFLSAAGQVRLECRRAD
jgi:hypothetical protein